MSRRSRDLRGIFLEVAGVQILMVFAIAPIVFLVLSYFFG
jgi:hypothetical protein